MEFKDDYSATLQDAVKIQRRFQKSLEGWNYMVGICGSTVTKGRGKDIDVVILAAAVADIPAWKVAEHLITMHSKRLFLFVIVEYTDYVDISVNFITFDGLYIDLYLKGEK